MEYFIIAFVILSGFFIWGEIGKIKKQNKELENKINQLFELTKNPHLSSYYVSDELKSKLLDLKNQGESVKAVHCLRQNTSFDLLQAKAYIDELKE